jgi:hypothetical protein
MAELVERVTFDPDVDTVQVTLDEDALEQPATE